ncbi:MAG: hypothetical protein J6328_04030 [Bacilli bacterium]|nr:hypothetical protein [Bacilli bacterium]
MKTNAAKTEKEFRKLAFDLTKAKYGETISISVVLFSALVISLLPGLYSISFLLFSVPLLFLPAVFAAEMKMRGAVKRDRPDYRETISMFGGYFFAPWRGVFRAMRTILITALIWAVASSISGVLYLGMASNFDKPFIAAYEAFQAAAEGASDYGELNEMMYEFVTSPEAANFEKTVLGFSSGIAGYYFLHSLGVSSLVAQLHFLFDGKPSSLITAFSSIPIDPFAQASPRPIGNSSSSCRSSTLWVSFLPTSSAHHLSRIRISSRSSVSRARASLCFSPCHIIGTS